MCGLGLVAMYVQRNPQESLHKPHDDAVAQVIHLIILIALIIRPTHMRIQLSAILSVKQGASLLLIHLVRMASDNKNG